MSAPSIAGGALTAGGSSSIAASIWGTAAIPIIGAAVAGVTMGLMLLFNRKGPKQKVATTQIVGQVEPFMRENLQGYFAGPRTVSAQAQALANFDAGWQYVVEHCDIPQMGNPGKACVSDRQAGACVWREGGECWNWFKGYRDPIANDVPVPDPVVGEQQIQTALNDISQAISQVIPGVDGGGGIYVLGAGVLLLLAAMR